MGQHLPELSHSLVCKIQPSSPKRAPFALPDALLSSHRALFFCPAPCPFLPRRALLPRQKHQRKPFLSIKKRLPLLRGGRGRPSRRGVRERQSLTKIPPNGRKIPNPPRLFRRCRRQEKSQQCRPGLALGSPLLGLSPEGFPCGTFSSPALHAAISKSPPSCPYAGAKPDKKSCPPVLRRGFPEKSCALPKETSKGRCANF